MDINDVKGLGTLFAMAAFLSIVAWAYSSRRKERFEKDGNMPFDDGDDVAEHSPGRRENNE